MSPLFVPGPVDVAPEVLAAQARPMVPQYSEEFTDLYQHVIDKLQRVFHTQNRLFLLPSSGSGMYEAAMRNLVQDSLVQDNVLCCINGAFSARWCDVAVANGKQAARLEVECGETITPDLLKETLQYRTYEAITIVHNETSSGIENPLRDLTQVIRQISPDTLILVDAISSLGGVNIEMDAWDIDFLFTTSQHCLALPPGVALASVSERAMRKIETVKNRGWYFDFGNWERIRLKRSIPMSVPISLFYALDVQLDRILTEGLENRYARHAALAKRVQGWAEAQGMEVMGTPRSRSKTISCIRNSHGLVIDDLNKFLLTRNMRIANGYGKLKDKYFRIATMGETQMNDLETLLESMDEYIKPIRQASVIG